MNTEAPAESRDSFNSYVAAVRRGERTANEAARDLVVQLDDREKLGLLDGDLDFWAGVIQFGRFGYNHEPIIAGAVPRLGIPGIRFTDGPRGIVMGRATCFPVSMARGATWDVDLEEEIGHAIGAEGRALGANLFAGVCINLLRHPAWGRAQETYGEDPVLLGRMGAALTRGVREHLMACVKHYALNSIENARFQVDVQVDEESLHSVYLAHFKDVLDAGAESVMSAYNSVNGTWCGENKTLLTDILRGEWGFTGFVMSDFLFGLRDPIGSIAAGLDLEMPFAQQRARALPRALADGRLDREAMETACERLVATQLAHYARIEAPVPDRRVVACAEHRALARRAAAQSMVLLRNETIDGAPLLPLAADSLQKVAVVGRLATKANFGDLGSSAVHPPAKSTPLDGLREALPGVTCDHAIGDEPQAAAELAAKADAAVVVVGYGARDEGEGLVAPMRDGENVFPPPLGGPIFGKISTAALGLAAKLRLVPGGDRRSLRLSEKDEALIEAVAAAQPRTVVVVIGASAVLMESWRARVPAILLAWYPGMEGGRALADVLLGNAEPGGRLPFAMPANEAHLPPFDPDARSIVYDRWWGQRFLDRNGYAAAYPLGFGLGYCRFELRNVRVDSVALEARRATVTVEIGNISDRNGATVIQLYAEPRRTAAVEGARRELVGFARVELARGETRAVALDATLKPLAKRNPADGTWSIPNGQYRVIAAQHWGDPTAADTEIPLDNQ